MDGDTQVEPVQVNESIIKNSYDDNLVQESQETMSYFRVATGDPHDLDDPERIDEFLLINAGEGVIELYLGVDLLLEEVSVI